MESASLTPFWPQTCLVWGPRSAQVSWTEGQWWFGMKPGPGVLNILERDTRQPLRPEFEAQQGRSPLWPHPVISSTSSRGSVCGLEWRVPPAPEVSAEPSAGTAQGQRSGYVKKARQLLQGSSSLSPAEGRAPSEGGNRWAHALPQAQSCTFPAIWQGTRIQLSAHNCTDNLPIVCPGHPRQ